MGPLSLLLSGFLLALSGVVIKALSEEFSSLAISFMRFFLAFLLAVLFCLIFREAFVLSGISKRILFVYATVFPLAVIFFVFAIVYGSVALASSSAFAVNILTSFFISSFFFREKIYWQKILAVIFVMLALLLLLFQGGDLGLSLGLLFGVACGVMQGIVNYSQKKLGQAKADKSSLLLLQTASGSIMIGIVLLVFEDFTFLGGINSFDWLLMFLAGLLVVLIIALFAFGFRHTALNTGSILVSSQLFFAPLLAFVFLGEAITLPLFLAIVSVFSAVLLVNYKDAFPNRGSLQE